MVMDLATLTCRLLPVQHLRDWYQTPMIVMMPMLQFFHQHQRFVTISTMIVTATSMKILWGLGTATPMAMDLGQ